MAGKAQEIAAKLLNVNKFMAHRLCRIAKQQRSMLMSNLGHPRNRRHCPKNVRHESNCNKGHFIAAQKSLERLKINVPLLAYGRNKKPSTRSLAKLLPRYEVRMMLKRRHRNGITGRQSRKRGCHHIDGVGRPSREHNFLFAFRIDEARDRRTSMLKGLGRPPSKCMDPTMHVGVVLEVMIGNPIEHSTGHLGRCRIIQVHKVMSTYRLT